MILERTLYFAKSGHESDVLAVRRRASRIRVELGLAAGAISVRHGASDAPSVAWECRFATESAHQDDLEARGASDAFSAIRKEMQTHLERFERHVLRQDEPVDDAVPSFAPEELRFPNGARELAGFLYRPAGAGPHPAVVLNHGSGVTQGSSDISKPSVASVLVSFGIACFFPNRWGYGNSPGRYWRDDVTAPFGSHDYDRQLVRRLHDESGDVISALDFVSGLPEIDAEHVGVMGSSFGGTVSLLAAAKCDRFRCAVDFAGAAMNWEKTPRLRELMKQACRAIENPLFLIQASNDYSTAPTTELGAVLESHGKVYRAKVYPPFGATRDEGHWFERSGALVWRDDVHRFLERHL